MYSDILKSTKTVEQKEQLALAIDQLLTSLFHQGKKEFEKALASIRLEIAQVIKDEFVNKPRTDSVQGKYPKADNKEMIKDFLKQLKERLQNLQLIKLTLAFSATQHAIDRIYDWILKNVGDRYILDIQVDKSMLGGAIISFEGRYIDLSLRKTLDEVFENKRREITSRLNS